MRILGRLTCLSCARCRGGPMRGPSGSSPAAWRTCLATALRASRAMWTATASTAASASGNLC